MGLGTRIALIFANIAILIPIYILVIIAAVMSSITASKIGKIQDKTSSVKKAFSYTIAQTIILWILSVGSLLFAFTIGLFIIPPIVQIPYLFGALLIIIAIVNLIMAGSFFYSAYAVTTSADYKKGDDNAKKAFTYSMIIGLIMFISTFALFGYAGWIIYDYQKYGGITQDIKKAAEIAPLLVPGVGEAVVGAEAGGLAGAIPQVAGIFGAKAADAETIRQALDIAKTLGVLKGQQ